ncbi:MAG: T9SS type A sorting domain-containing protein [Bacteroidetes bacterium]|nr:T9SS type A sorting domain-containing protein [Bacteroidota bacterium]
MKSKLITFLLFIFMSSVGLHSANACRQGGFDISYIHLNGPNYRVHCNFYRDCSGIMLNTLTLTVTSVNCGYTNTYTMVPVTHTGLQLTHACYGHDINCNGGSELGMELWEYEVDVVLGQCPDWSLSVYDCCRNSAITTLQSPATGLVVEARLDNSIDDNSSPQFQNNPFFIGYPNQDFHFNNGAVDPDGDSLVYLLVAPRMGLNTLINYFPPLSSQQPFESLHPITLDSSTGDFFMHPTIAQVGVIVYEILEYRNGQLIGSVTRDIILFILPYPNNSPGLSGINGGIMHTVNAFPGYELCFDILSNDLDAGDSLFITWNQGIPLGSFTSSNSLHPAGTFCWTPQWNDARPQPYIFTASVTDNGCPISSTAIFSYAVYVTTDSTLINSTISPSGEANMLTISPNPSNGVFTILNSEKFSNVRVYNPLGVRFSEKVVHGTINLSNQPAGIYFVEAVMHDGKATWLKVIKE